MAWKEGVGQPHYFVEEIDYNEIEQLEVVGKGSFGVVWKGKWRETYVAVKRIDSEAEKKAFAVEVRQLSRVSHPNIVKLYGACTQNPVCLVMEYAEGGSLYNVLHCRPLPKYTAGHAMSWALQCAKGVAYLHNMKPKALIHRDLKPPNLLLIKGGEVLKICDFGTACDKKTYMTNNKGSAAWMAPEVFEGSNYTEKCDVFSWGIILWEVLSRRKPFDDIGGSAFRIMWAVHTGERPPLINGCPKPIEELMTRCWDKNPVNRPPMDEVVRIMSLLFVYFSGYDEPVQYSTDSSSCSSGDSEELQDEDCTPETLDSKEESRNTLSDNQKPVFTPSMNGSHGASDSQMRNTKEKFFTPLSVDVDTDAWNLGESSPWLQNGSASESVDMEIRNMAGLDKVVFKPRPQAQRCPPSLKEQNASSRPHTPPEELDNIYIMLDPQLHPVTPDNSCQQSVQIFEQHKKLAQEYLKVQTEIAYLTRYMDQLAERLSEAEGLSQLDQQDTERHQEELRKLENEKKSLLALHRNLKQQLEIIKREPTNNVSDDGWVVLPNQEPSHVP